VVSGGPKCWFTSASPERAAQQQSFPSESGVVCSKWCALFHVYIMFFQDFLPYTSTMLTLRASIEPEKIKLFNGVLRSGNSWVAAKLWP